MTNARPSHFGRRVAAYAADVTILFAVLAPLGAAVNGAAGSWPQTPPEIYRTLLWNFSLPVWACFIACDRWRGGRTAGKSLAGLSVRGRSGGVSLGAAAVRTAVKLLPWEATHFGAFVLMPWGGSSRTAGIALIAAAYAASAAYLVAAWRTGGRRSVHDRVAGTLVVRDRP